MLNTSNNLLSILAKFSMLWFILSTYNPSVFASDVELFNTKIKPILQQKCFSCHSHESKKNKGGLVLDSLAGMLEGGDSGSSIIVGKPEKSKLVEAILHQSRIQNAS